MGLFRRRDNLGGIRYRLRERLFSIGDDFWIETEGGGRALTPDDGPAQCHPGESSAQSDQCLRVGSESRAETDRGGPRRVRERRSRPFPGCRPPDPLQALDLVRGE